MSRTAACMQAAVCEQGQPHVSRTAAGKQDSSMYASRAAVCKQGQPHMSRTAACEQENSMSQAAPHELDRFKGKTAADKKDWCRSRAETSCRTAEQERDSSM